jgi:hypothetical protein
MKHTHKPLKTSELIKLFSGMNATCKTCGTRFPLTQELQDLIESGIIHPLDVNLCASCAEEAEEQANEEAILEAELECIINNL